MSKIVLASSNQGKLKEIQAICSSLPLTLVAQSSLNIDDADETGLSFVENSLIKARHAAALSNLPAIADDSGLVVDALNGEPGVYSARYAGENASDQANINKLLQQLDQVSDEQRSARFYCVISYVKNASDPIPIICQGSWPGQILRQAIGDNGFGYDPVFYLKEHNCSSAQLEPELKNRISHRAKALACLLEKLKLIANE